MKELKFKETKKAVAQAIDENFVCFAEDFSRNLEDQLDRIERRQKHWIEYVNDSLNPALKEIRDALRPPGDKHDNH